MYIKLQESTHLLTIQLYLAMLKQKILPVQPLIQGEAGRAKKSFLFSWDLKWPSSGILILIVPVSKQNVSAAAKKITSNGWRVYLNK